MAKRAHIKTSDGIDVLPDELLVCILDFLTLKEAAGTSILCRRWRYLWTFTNKLDFDGSDFFWRVGSRVKHFEHLGSDFLEEVWSVSKNFEESWNYIAWVNNILKFHKCSSIEEFRIDFLLYEDHKKYIDRWLKFASVKEVKRLELNLRWIFCSPDGYIFPCELLSKFKHLRTMRLQWVNVSGESIELLLGNCPLLEELSVSFSEQLVALKLIGPSLALKRLEISYCYLTSVEIRDVNLEFLMYDGGLLEQFVLKNVPLVEMHLGGVILSEMKDLLLMFSSYLPQLEKLTIDGFYMNIFDKGARMFYNNVKMSKLRHLKFMHPRMCEHMLPVAYFLRAAPLLQSFVLEVYTGSNREESWYFVDSLPKYLGAYEYPHLKRVEMIGYRGTSSELDLAVHLLKNGSALEQFIVDLRKRHYPYMIDNYYWPNNINGGLLLGYPCMEEDDINAVKVRVKKQLTKRMDSILQQHLHLIIL